MALAFQPLPYICDTNVGVSVRFGFRRIKPASVIDYGNDYGIRCQLALNPYGASLFLFGDAVTNRIFHQGLECERRKEEIIKCNVPFNIQTLFKPHFFQVEIVLHMVYFFAEGNQPDIGKRIQVSS